MTSFYIFLGISLVGMCVVVFLLISEQRKSKKALDQIQKSHQEKEKAVSQKENLIGQLKSFEDENKRLKQLLEEKRITKIFTGDIRQKMREFLDSTKIQEIMSKKVIAINENEKFSKVPEKMREHSIRHLPVVDDDRKLVGLITQRMLYQIRSPRKLMDGEWHYDDEMLNNVILKNVMQKDVFVLSSQNSVGQALLKIVRGKVGCIPIVSADQKIEGVVTRNDILKLAAGSYDHE